MISNLNNNTHSTLKSKDVVIECRRTIFRGGKQLKEADCSKEYIPKSSQVRICITERMKRQDPNYYFRDGVESNNEEISPPREFLNCLDAGFGGMSITPTNPNINPGTRSSQTT
jgi:hypothetical protein